MILFFIVTAYREPVKVTTSTSSTAFRISLIVDREVLVYRNLRWVELGGRGTNKDWERRYLH